MNLKKSLAGLFAGFALLGALAAPAALAADDTATGTVVVTDGGVLTVAFCQVSNYTHPGDFTLTQVTAPTAYAAGTATGSLQICYIDTKTYRPSFEVSVSASNFESGSNIITSDNFTVTKTYNVGSIHYDGQAGPVGEIGYFQNNAYVTPQLSAGAPWTFDNDFSTSRTLQFGYGGRGTEGSAGKVDVSLKLPAATLAGTYTSNLTLTVMSSTLP
jgi:hypothetical protein